MDPIIRDKQCSCCEKMLGKYDKYMVSQFIDTRPKHGRQKTKDTYRFTSCCYHGSIYRDIAIDKHNDYPYLICRVATYRSKDGKPVELVVKEVGKAAVITTFD